MTNRIASHIIEAEFIEAMEKIGCVRIEPLPPPNYEPPDVSFPQTMRYECPDDLSRPEPRMGGE